MLRDGQENDSEMFWSLTKKSFIRVTVKVEQRHSSVWSTWSRTLVAASAAYPWTLPI
jgi:hypothetical protein